MGRRKNLLLKRFYFSKFEKIDLEKVLFQKYFFFIKKYVKIMSQNFKLEKRILLKIKTKKI